MDHSWGYGSERRLRNENQDSFGVFEFPDLTLAIVCDGMGGHVGGAQASALAVRTIHDAIATSDLSDVREALSQAVQAANLAIFEAARKNHRLTGMGTTCVVAAISDSAAWFAHVGDSRAYLVRSGHVQQMTRDHTMVNLFVDAELLTPEDAATHPEAHVLSRSLGVERQVEVEVSERVELAVEDVIFLCSDGVHGVITEWEIANVDWGAPHEGIRHILDIVISREGDDNATAVAVLSATSFEDVPATPLPDPGLSEESVPEVGSMLSGVTAVPLDDDLSTSLYGEEVIHEPLPIGQPAAQPAPEPAAPEAPNPSQAREQPASAAPDLRKRPKSAGNGRARVLALGVALALTITVGVGGMLSMDLGSLRASDAAPTGEPAPNGDPSPSDAANPAEAPGEAATAEVAGAATAAGTPEDEAAMWVVSGEPAEEGDVGSDPAAVDATAGDALLFAPILPAAPRRLPHRAARYTQPPPGGPNQWQAVQAARNKECSQALDAVTQGMRMSMDHATLYQQAWFCFNENVQRPLAEAKAADWSEFSALVYYFEGSAEDRPSDTGGDTEAVPSWSRPAVGGLEYRLERYMSSNRQDKFADVMSDLLGDPVVADHLANDLILEATAAAGLAQTEAPTDPVIEAWARRVYVVTRTIHGPIGQLLDTHRPEVMPHIRALLDAATTRPSPVDGAIAEDGATPPADEAPFPPEMVALARDVAAGVRPLPEPKAAVVTRPKPVAPKEPKLEELQDFGGAKVYRRD